MKVLEIAERRQTLLKHRSMGVPLAETVKQLSESYNVSARAIYHDWRNRESWMRALLEIDSPNKLYLDIFSNFKEIYHRATLEYLKGDNSNARIGALRLLKDLNETFLEMIKIDDVTKRVERLEGNAAKN